MPSLVGPSYRFVASPADRRLRNPSINAQCIQASASPAKCARRMGVLEVMTTGRVICCRKLVICIVRVKGVVRAPTFRPFKGCLLRVAFGSGYRIWPL